MAFTVIPGGAGLSTEQIDREVLDGWAILTDACERALSQMHPAHPERHEWTEMLAAFREAARLTAPNLRPADREN